MEEGKKEVEQKFLEEVKQSHMLEKKNHQGLGAQRQNFYPIHEYLLQECNNIKDSHTSIHSLNSNKNAIHEDISDKTSRLEKIIIPSQSQDALDNAQGHLNEEREKLREVGINIEKQESLLRKQIRDREESLRSYSKMMVEVESALFKYQQLTIKEKQYRQRFRELLEILSHAQKEYDACENGLRQFESEVKLVESEIFATKLEKKNIALRKELQSLKNESLQLAFIFSDVAFPII